MKKRIIPFAVIVLALLVGAKFYIDGKNEKIKAETEQDAQADGTLVHPGSMAPDFTVEMFLGEKVTLSSLKGRVVLLNFWATWCPPCRQEMTRMDEVVRRFADRDFTLLAISRGEKKEVVAAFRQEMGYTFPMALDPDMKIYPLYASQYIPRTFLINREGKVVMSSVGYEKKEFDLMLDEIDKLTQQ